MGKMGVYCCCSCYYCCCSSTLLVVVGNCRDCVRPLPPPFVLLLQWRWRSILLDAVQSGLSMMTTTMSWRLSFSAEHYYWRPQPIAAIDGGVRITGTQRSSWEGGRRGRLAAVQVVVIRSIDIDIQFIQRIQRSSYSSDERNGFRKPSKPFTACCTSKPSMLRTREPFLHHQAVFKDQGAFFTRSLPHGTHLGCRRHYCCYCSIVTNKRSRHQGRRRFLLLFFKDGMALADSMPPRWNASMWAKLDRSNTKLTMKFRRTEEPY